MNEIHRDEQLGAALRELRVPEHGPGFWSRLEEQLAAEAAGGGRRIGRRRRMAPPRRWRPIAAAAGAVAAVILALTLALPGGERPERALAAEMQERVRAGITELRDVRGSGLWRVRGDDERHRFSFALTAEGDVRLRNEFRAENGFIELAYDADRAVERQVLGPDLPLYTERTGVAPGPPDLGPTEIPPQQRIGAAIRALLATDDPRVSETSWRGRDAWRAVLDSEPGEQDLDQLDEQVAGADLDRLLPDRVVVVIDQQTGLPVRIRGTLEGHFIHETRVNRLAVNSGLPHERFELRFPSGAKVERVDSGFRRVPLDRVAEIVGYEPLVPRWVPEGYELSDVAVAQRDRGTRNFVGDRGNPRGRDVVSLSYRRGLGQVVVTTRRVGEEPDRWGNPFDDGFEVSGFEITPERLRIEDGALAGSEGELVIAPLAPVIPHLWALGDDLVLTVAGDLSRDELVRIAESLAGSR